MKFKRDLHWTSMKLKKVHYLERDVKFRRRHSKKQMLFDLNHMLNRITFYKSEFE